MSRYGVALYFAFVAGLCGQSISTSFSFGGSGTAFTNSPVPTSLADTAQTIAVDSAGNMFVAGTAFSQDFPQINALTLLGKLPQCNANCIFRSSFLAKIDHTGSFLVYSTLLGAPSSYLGIESAALLPIAVAVDAVGNAYVTGTTSFANFPAAKGNTLSFSGGMDAFLMKLDLNGNVLYSTLFGSSADDVGNSIALGSDGKLYIAWSTNSSALPTVDQDLFLSTFDAATGRTLSSISLGQGTKPQLALAPAGQLYIVALRGCQQCSPRLVLLKVDPIASKVSTTPYLGDAGTTLLGIATGADGSLSLATSGTPRLIRFDSAGTPIFSRDLNAFSGPQPNAFAIDPAGNVYLGGLTTQTTFPTLHASQSNLIPAECFTQKPDGAIGYPYFCTEGGFVSALNSSGTTLNWSTFVGDIGSTVTALATDAKGSVYAAGYHVALSGPNVGKPISVVRFSPQNPVITVMPDSLTNAASYSVGLPQGRGLATVFLTGLSGINGVVTASGFPLPTQLSGVSVKVNDTLAPILSVASTSSGQQINFQVPFIYIPIGSVLQISQNGNVAVLGALTSAPGIFLLPSGVPAIQHGSDYSLITADNPVVPGEIIIIYATGLLDTNPGPQDGMPFTAAVQTSYPTYVTIGETYTAKVLYAGPTPGYVGLFQINCQIPAQLPSGLQTLTIKSGIQYVFDGASSTTSKPVPLPVR